MEDREGKGEHFVGCLSRNLHYTVCMFVCLSCIKRAAISQVFNLNMSAHFHYECRPGSLVESPRGVLERPGPQAMSGGCVNASEAVTQPPACRLMRRTSSRGEEEMH